MRTKILAALVLLPALATGEVGGKTAASEAHGMTAVELVFLEQEPGVEPYRTRMLVTRDWLRIDDGNDGGDFVLYDRRRRSIASVSHANRSVLRIHHHAVEIEPPVALEHAEQALPDPQAPEVGGVKPVHYRFITNGQVCKEVMAAPGLLEQARAALAEYRQTLAGEQALNLHKTPAEMQTPCMLAELIFLPARHLAHGFPIQEWDPQGRSRSLVSYREGVSVDARLFEVPADYGSFAVNPADD